MLAIQTRIWKDALVTQPATSGMDIQQPPHIQENFCSGTLLTEKSLSNRFGIKSQNKDLGWNQTAMLYETFFSFSEEQLPFQPHVKCF